MKPYQFILLFLGFLSLKASAIPKDTIYKRGIFLIPSRGKTNIDLIEKGKPLKHRTSKGDTIYEDKKYLILGDDNVCMGQVFKKYHLKYRFSSFAAGIYKGKLAKPDFKTDKDAWLFRTQIRMQCQEEGINFAGHYTIAMWGCGSPCQQIAIIDRINGKIYYSHIPEVNGALGWQLKYKADSRLIIVNADLLAEHKGYIDCTSVGKVLAVEWLNDKSRRLPE